MASVAMRRSASREAGPRRCLGAALLEPDPDRVQERAGRQGQDGEAVATATSSGSARRVPRRSTRAMVARRGYSSSSVRACSHQPSMTSSVGGLR